MTSGYDFLVWFCVYLDSVPFTLPPLAWAGISAWACFLLGECAVLTTLSGHILLTPDNLHGPWCSSQCTNSSRIRQYLYMILVRHIATTDSFPSLCTPVVLEVCKYCTNIEATTCPVRSDRAGFDNCCGC
ncbi:hypothetical protein BC835DRAFT_1359731 [Cytidiella melzeri]|nr:hypothetical protein BC835DRAFT_1359731 [Cytidiella melzeri]